MVDETMATHGLECGSSTVPLATPSVPFGKIVIANNIVNTYSIFILNFLGVQLLNIFHSLFQNIRTSDINIITSNTSQVL